MVPRRGRRFGACRAGGSRPSSREAGCVVSPDVEHVAGLGMHRARRGSCRGFGARSVPWNAAGSRVGVQCCGPFVAVAAFFAERIQGARLRPQCAPGPTGQPRGLGCARCAVVECRVDHGDGVGGRASRPGVGRGGGQIAGSIDVSGSAPCLDGVGQTRPKNPRPCHGRTRLRPARRCGARFGAPKSACGVPRILEQPAVQSMQCSAGSQRGDADCVVRVKGPIP